MRKRIFTKEQIYELEQNKFVKRILHRRTIDYKNIFKIYCILTRKYEPEKTCNEIFKEAGFNLDYFHPDYARRRIYDWLNLYDKFGINYFIGDK